MQLGIHLFPNSPRMATLFFFKAHTLQGMYSVGSEGLSHIGNSHLLLISWGTLGKLVILCLHCLFFEYDFGYYLMGFLKTLT